MTERERAVLAFRLALALGVWLASVLLHRVVSDAVGEPVATPWGAFRPIDYTTEAAAVLSLAALIALGRAAWHGGARRATCVLWGLLLALMIACHLALVTIDIEVIHYPQYALVAVLLARALDPRRHGCPLLEVVLLSVALSTVDEAVQYLHLMRDARYFDFNDLALNQLGTLAGLLWHYGFPRAGRGTPAATRPLLRGLLIGAALCAATAGGLVYAGVLVVNPQAPITQADTVRLAGGLRVVLQWTPDIYNAWRPSRSGGTYFVIGPLPWLALLLATTLATWLVERRLLGATMRLRLGALSIMRPFAAHGVRAGVGAKETIAILGGTGDLGTGLAMRWARAGHRIVIGSRTLEKAEKAVAQLERIRPRSVPDQYAAMTNPDAAEAGEIVVLTVPAAHQIATLESVRAGLAGKILIDVTVPLVPPRVGTVQLPSPGSAGQRAQALLGRGVRVVTAFQNVAAHLLKQDVAIECDVLVCGNQRAARQRVVALAEAAGMAAWHAGPIENSAAAEALTSVLIQINRRHKIAHSGIKIVGQAH